MGMYLEHPNITVKSIGQALEFLSVAFPSFRCRGEGAMFGDAALGRRLHFGNDETYDAFVATSTQKIEDRAVPAAKMLGFAVICEREDLISVQ